MNSQNTAIQNKTIALAGVHLALTQIQRVAWHGSTDQQQLQTSLQSLFVDQPESYMSVYGSIEALRPGLLTLKESLTEIQKKAVLERYKYQKSLFSLTKKFSKNNYLVDQISTTLELIKNNEMVVDQEQELITRCAELYQNTLSTLQPRIIIYGQPDILAQSQQAATIRSLLLAGVRSTLLWYQAGGSGLTLAINRSSYLHSIDQFLSQ